MAYLSMGSRVQIYIPTYNSERFLRSTLESVARQTYPRIDVCVSDHGSTDLTLKIATAFPSFRIVERGRGNGNLFDHWNLCLREAHTDYAGIFHADDLYLPHAVEAQVSFLDAHPDVDAVLCQAEVIDESAKRLWLTPLPRGSLPVLDPMQVLGELVSTGNSFLICPSALFRTSSVHRFGGFDPALPNAADLDLWMRILFEGKLGFIAQPLMRYRLSVSQTSARYQETRKEQSDFFTVMDRYASRLPKGGRELTSYTALRALDRLHVALQDSAQKRGSTKVMEALDWFKSHRTTWRSALGFADRLKVNLALQTRFLLKTPLASPLSKWILAQTDPQRSRTLRRILATKRALRP